MKLDLCGAAAGRALGLGLVAGAWLAAPASLAGVETSLPSGTAPAAPAAPAEEPILLAQGDVVVVETQVSYANDQAERGKKRFAADCEDCHGMDLKGGINGGAMLRGSAFEEKYANGLPASILFSFMSSMMPPNSPGRYSPSTYADLMAFVLKTNGFRSGSPLPSDFDALDALAMTK